MLKIMVKIDMKDRKILYQLDINSRQSISRIGKSVGLSKNVVAYRINRLIDEGIIENFYTVIDSYKLGYIVFRFYIIFQYVTPKIKKEIIEYFVHNRSTWFVGSTEGRYDLSVVLWVNDINNFYQFWVETLDRYGDYFAQKTFSIYIKSYSYRRSYLLLDKYKKSDRLDFEITGVGKKMKIDNFDMRLLNKIAVNARAPIIDLAKKLDCSSKMVQYRLKNLIKSGVIQAFRTTIDLSKLGLRFFKVDIHLRAHKHRKLVLNYVKYNPYLVYIAASAGESDLELEFHVENSDRMNQIMEEITIEFPDAIRYYQYISFPKVHKTRYMPEPK